MNLDAALNASALPKQPSRERQMASRRKRTQRDRRAPIPEFDESQPR